MLLPEKYSAFVYKCLFYFSIELILNYQDCYLEPGPVMIYKPRPAQNTVFIFCSDMDTLVLGH